MPATIHGEQRDPLGARFVEQEVPYGYDRLVGQPGEHRLGRVEGRRGLVVDRGDHAATLDLCASERIARGSHVDASDRECMIAGLLVREWMENAATDLEELVGRDRVEVAHAKTQGEPFSAALHLEVDLVSDALVQE
jgi:hypothetical protein